MDNFQRTYSWSEYSIWITRRTTTFQVTRYRPHSSIWFFPIVIFDCKRNWSQRWRYSKYFRDKKLSTRQFFETQLLLLTSEHLFKPIWLFNSNVPTLTLTRMWMQTSYQIFHNICWNKKKPTSIFFLLGGKAVTKSATKVSHKTHGSRSYDTNAPVMQTCHSNYICLKPTIYDKETSISADSRQSMLYQQSRLPQRDQWAWRSELELLKANKTNRRPGLICFIWGR